MWGYLTVSFCTSLVVSAAWILITRRYGRLWELKFQEYDKMLDDKVQQLQAKEFELNQKNQLIEQKTIALRKLYHKVHHDGPRPVLARILGLLNLYWLEAKSLRELITLLGRPNHHGYGILAEKQLIIMEGYLSKAEMASRELYDSIAEDVQEFEHLQDDC